MDIMVSIVMAVMVILHVSRTYSKDLGKQATKHITILG